MNSISAFSFLNFCFYPRETAVIEFQFSKFQLSAFDITGASSGSPIINGRRVTPPSGMNVVKGAITRGYAPFSFSFEYGAAKKPQLINRKESNLRESRSSPHDSATHDSANRLKGPTEEMAES